MLPYWATENNSETEKDKTTLLQNMNVDDNYKTVNETQSLRSFRSSNSSKKRRSFITKSCFKKPSMKLPNSTRLKRNLRNKAFQESVIAIGQSIANQSLSDNTVESKQNQLLPEHYKPTLPPLPDEILNSTASSATGLKSIV